ncbi:hypothetical protein ACJJTC_002211 [Scirpophaga incertulas]
MFGLRTPKKRGEEKATLESPPNTRDKTVRRSIGEWEAAGASQQKRSPPRNERPIQTGSTITKKPKETKTQEIKDMPAKPQELYPPAKGKLEEARRQVEEIKRQLTLTRNMNKEPRNFSYKTDVPSNEMVENRKILEKIEEQTTLMRETNRNTEEIKKMIELQGEKMRTDTYAGVAAGRQVDPKENRRALHSLIITSENEEHTGEQVLAELRDTIDAKQGWVKVEKVRKAKDRKVIVSCESVGERLKIKDKIEQSGKKLRVEEVKNRNPPPHSQRRPRIPHG